MFCFLPLHLTGLSVHISANFAVMNDRRGIYSSDSVAKSEEVQFNLKLMSCIIPQSYFTLLVLLHELYMKGIGRSSVLSVLALTRQLEKCEPMAKNSYSLGINLS